MAVQVREGAARDPQTPSSPSVLGSRRRPILPKAPPVTCSPVHPRTRALYENGERVVYPLDQKLRFNLQDFSEGRFRASAVGLRDESRARAGVWRVYGRARTWILHVIRTVENRRKNSKPETCYLKPIYSSSSSSFQRSQLRAIWALRTAKRRAKRPFLLRAPSGFYLNPAAYAPPAPGRWGNAGRNSVTGPAQLGLNAGISRTFPWGDRLNLDWRIDASNVLNRVTYAGVNALVGSPQFGLPTRANPMRKLQTSLRLRF